MTEWYLNGVICAGRHDLGEVAYPHSNHSALTIHNLYDLHVPKKTT